MDVRLTVGWEVKVDDDVDRGDVKPSRRDVRSDEDVATAGAELAQRAESGGLGQLAVQRDGAEAEGAEEDGDALGFVDGAGEDDGGLAGEFVEQVDEIEVLVLLREEHVRLEEGGDGLVFVRGDGDAEGVLERGALQGFDFGGHGRGEEVGVSILVREHFEDLVEDRAEVEV